MRTIAYIDGFNLYYRALKDRAPECKWLDMARLCTNRFPNNTFVKIKLFTADVTAKPGDPSRPFRQQI